MNFSSAYVAEPPPGQLRHATNPPNLHAGLAAVGVSTTVVALLAVALRVFTRARVTDMGVHLNDRESNFRPVLSVSTALLTI